MVSWGLVSPPTENRSVPWQAIGRALASQGLPPLMIDTTDTPATAAWILEVSTPGSSLESLPATYRHRIGADNGEPGVCLLITDPTEHRALRACDGILIAARVSPDGLRQAYVLVKKLVALVPEAELGIVLTDVRDEDAARQGYGALSVATHRFLGRHIGSFGYLSREALQSGYEGGGGRTADLLKKEAYGIASLIAADSLAMVPQRAGTVDDLRHDNEPRTTSP